MEKIRRNEALPIIKAIALWLVLTASFTVISAAITTTVKDPINTSSVSAKICIILSSFISGIVIRIDRGNVLHALILSAFTGMTILFIACVDGVSSTGIIMSLSVFLSSIIGYIITNILRTQRKQRRRKR